MSCMGRCVKHGCAFSARLIDGTRDEYCPECEIDHLRTALATAQAEQAEAALAQAQAERDSLIKRLDFWIECNNGERANGRMPTFLNPYTILLWIGDKRVVAEADAAQPHALPPLPPDWHERYGDTWVGFYYLEYDEDTGSQIVATRLGVDVDTIGTVNVSDLITVLRHAEAAHQRLRQEGE